VIFSDSIYNYKFSTDFDSENFFLNQLIFGEVKAYKIVPFWATLYM